ncbi:MAG: triose-phosphate isomerase [bacterium]
MTKLIVANWKAQLNLKASLQLAKAYATAFKKSKQPVVACPSEFALVEVRNILQKSSVKLGAQNVFSQPNGAYTGEVSAQTLKDLGCSYVIIGHSERRQYLGESCELINAKIKAALAAKLIPIVCVGENWAKRQAKQSQAFVKGQLQRALKNIKTKQDIIIAYEPIWAIGTGKVIKPSDAQIMQQYIKQTAQALLGQQAKLKVLYGGSVTAQNAVALLAVDSVDGLLIGGTSLEISAMKKIANIK